MREFCTEQAKNTALQELGVRIEGHYWIITGGNVCLSEQLPESADEGERLMTE